MKKLLICILTMVSILCFSQTETIIVYTPRDTSSATGQNTEYVAGESHGKLGAFIFPGYRRGQLRKNEMTGIMDTSTCCITGRIFSIWNDLFDGTKLELKSKGFEYVTESDKIGDFDIMHIPAGVYTLQVTNSLHKKLVVKNIKLKSGGIYRWELYLVYKYLDRDYEFIRVKASFDPQY